MIVYKYVVFYGLKNLILRVRVRFRKGRERWGRNVPGKPRNQKSSLRENSVKIQISCRLARSVLTRICWREECVCVLLFQFYSSSSCVDVFLFYCVNKISLFYDVCACFIVESEGERRGEDARGENREICNYIANSVKIYISGRLAQITETHFVCVFYCWRWGERWGEKARGGNNERYIALLQTR